MLRLLEEASSRPLTTVAQDVLYCRDKLADLGKVTRKNTSPKEELKIVTKLSVGLKISIRHRQPVFTAAFLARRLRTSPTTDGTEYVKKAMTKFKYISQLVGRHGH